MTPISRGHCLEIYQHRIISAHLHYTHDGLSLHPKSGFRGYEPLIIPGPPLHVKISTQYQARTKIAHLCSIPLFMEEMAWPGYLTIKKIRLCILIQYLFFVSCRAGKLNICWFDLQVDNVLYRLH